MFLIRLGVAAMATLLAAGCVSTGYAGGHGGYGDDYGVEYAPVVHVEPIYEPTPVPVRDDVCYEEEVYYPERHPERSAVPAVVGAVVGGIIGNRIGKHAERKHRGYRHRGHRGRGYGHHRRHHRGRNHSNRGLAAAGAVIGGVIGNEIHKSRHPDGYRRGYETRCEARTRYRDEPRLLGYDVTYRYNGRLYETRMDYDPGSEVRVDWRLREGHRRY